jgi:hypothetical protein
MDDLPLHFNYALPINGIMWASLMARPENFWLSEETAEVVRAP